jgi:hypothetical protein
MFGFLGIEAGVTGGKLALALFRKLWWSLPIIGLGIALMLTRSTLANTKQDRDHWAGLFHQEKAAFAGTVANYRAAQKVAEDRDRAHAARVEADQRKVNQEKSHEYQARLDALRARFERVRHGEGGQADRGSAGTAGVPGVPGSSERFDGAAAPGDLQFNAEANAIQLEELQRWVREQAGIRRDKD